MNMIPIIVSSGPPRCPKCRNIEHKVEVCAHCDYHYPEPEETGMVGFIILIIMILTPLALLMWPEVLVRVLMFIYN